MYCCKRCCPWYWWWVFTMLIFIHTPNMNRSADRYLLENTHACLSPPVYKLLNYVYACMHTKMGSYRCHNRVRASNSEVTMPMIYKDCECNAWFSKHYLNLQPFFTSSSMLLPLHTKSPYPTTSQPRKCWPWPCMHDTWSVMATRSHPKTWKHMHNQKDTCYQRHLPYGPNTC